MRVLVLGGTRMIGRALAEEALARGHSVTLFNRGRSDPGALPGAEHVAGDRSQGLDALRGRTWDAVIDSSGYAPDDVRLSAGALRDAVGRYVYVSTISVYRDFKTVGMDEDAPLLEPDWGREERIGPLYGAQKAACERVLRDAFDDEALVVRPTLVVGPHDYTDRFTWWLRRVARGGEVLAPGAPGRPVQWIDARDLGGWMVRAAEGGLTGTYNAVGPERPATFGEVLETMRAVAGSGARFTWVGERFLRERRIGLHFWEDEGDIGVFTLSNRRALAGGLAFRPLAETVRDTLAWEPTRDPAERHEGLAPEREAELLREWSAVRA